MPSVVPGRTETIDVLHVDDNLDFADLTSAFIEREENDLRVETATDVSEALNRLAEREFDCIVSAYDMPGQSGIEFLETVREERPRLPFILYTGNGSEEVASDAISAGVTDYLRKESGTSQRTVLVDRIRNAVEQYLSRQEVEETTQILSQLAENTDDVLFVFNHDWSELLFINSAYEDIWDSTIVELRNEPSSFLKHVHADDREDVIQSMERLSNGEADQLEYRVVRPDGEQRWTRVESKPLVDDDGSVFRIVGFARDITERKQHEQELKEAKRRLSLALQEAEAGIWEWNLTTGELYWSDELLELLGLSADEFAGAIDAFEERLHPDDVDRIEEAIEEALETNEPYWVEQRIKNNSGEYVWFDIRGQVLNGSTSTSLIGIGIDITDRKNKETQLQRQRDRLEEFASIVSHDLRNPLNVATLRLGLAMDDCESEQLDHVARAHERMNQLIDDLLSLAREGEDVGDVEPVDLAVLTEHCWENIATGEATMTTNLGRALLGDYSRLQQLLENLLRNAVEHGGEDVTVAVGELDDGFYVEDDGPGIPSDKRDDVFAAGYSTTEGGTGFGLSIVRQVAESHGWDIRLVEGSGGGARFEITGVEFTP